MDRKSRIETLKTTEFDIIVIGGGITGAGIARDAATRGLKVALIEKNDFGSGTSSKSSRLIHAGLRYVKNLEFGLVREGSKERRILLNYIPNKVKPMPFIVPIYKGEKPTQFQMKVALWLYDILASFKNHKRHRFISKKKTLELTQNKLLAEGLISSALYYDAQMDDARLTLEVILSSESFGTTILNYAKIVDFIKENDITVGVKVKDVFSNEEFIVRGKRIVSATGVWTDKLLTIDNLEHKPKVRGTKGIHLITPKIMDNRYTVTLWRKEDGRIMFVIPWASDYSLVGTTDTDYHDDLDHVQIEEEDITYLLTTINEKFPLVNLTRDKIISVFAGVRPLVLSPTAKSESDVSRSHVIFKTPSNIWVIVGGKFTTFRKMAEELVDEIVKDLNLKGIRYHCHTKRIPLFTGDEKTLIGQLMEERGVSTQIAQHWVAEYGCRIQTFLDFYDQQSPDLQSVINSTLPYSWAEILFSIRYEYALTLEDILLRRTQLGYYNIEKLIVHKIAQLMAIALNWDLEKVKNEQTAFYQRIWHS